MNKYDWIEISCLIGIAILCVCAVCRGEPTPFRLDTAKLAKLEKISRRVTLEGREIADGKIIERWRDGSRTWTTTNAPVTIEGKKLKSTFTEKTAKLDKAEKAAKKAAKKDAKNLEKFIRDTQKARDKSGEEMRALYDGVLDIITNAAVSAAN